MNIAIFNHYFTDFYYTKQRDNSVAILNYLKDMINNKHNFLIFDIVKNYKKRIDLPKELLYLKKYLKNDSTEYLFFNEYYQFGSKNNFNHKELISFKPDVILISSFAFCYFNGFKETVDYLKKILKNIIIIAGGNGPSSNPIFYLTNSKIDYIVVGPAELSLNKLLDCLEKNIEPSFENIVSRNSNNYTLNLDVKYDFLPFIKELDKKRLSLQLTRGCPKNCSYCSIKLVSGNNFLNANLQNIKKIIEKLNIEKDSHFYFEDDNITYKKGYFLEIVKYIRSYFPNSTFSLENGIDWQTLDPLYLKELIDNGLNQLNISLTSIAFNVLKKNNRNYTIEKFDHFITDVEKYDIPVIVYFISGLLNDKKENILNTILYLTTKKVIIGISNFYPVPNTEIAKNIKKELRPELCKGSSFYKWAKINTKTLITFFILVRFINAIKKIDFFNIQDLKNLAECIKIKGNYIVSKKKLSRRELTIIGIINSIRKKKIFAINKKNEHYILSSYKCSKNILKIFFKKILNEIPVYTKYGKIEPQLWKSIINLFQ